MKRILAVILLCCLLLIGCGQSKTKKPIYELPGISWGDSIKQAEKVFGELTVDERNTGEYETYIQRGFRANGSFRDCPAEYLLVFMEVGGESYLTCAVVYLDTDQLADEAHLALIKQYEQDTVSIPTVADLTEGQKERYQHNCDAFGIAVQEDEPLFTLSRTSDTIKIIADRWVLANVDIAVE